MIVEVFKTNIKDEAIARVVIKQLSAYYPSAKINFDLEDVDNVLRIENNSTITAEDVIARVAQMGYHSAVL